jgi:trehalose synthase-fused probable maltokinase
MSEPDAVTSGTFDWGEELNQESLKRMLPRLLDGFLERYLPRQRWYGEKGNTLSEITVDSPDVAMLGESFVALSVASLRFEGGQSFQYFVPFVVEPGESERTLLRIEAVGSIWSLTDSSSSDRFHTWLWQGTQGRFDTEHFRWHVGTDNAEKEKPASRLLSGEQSNTNIAFGDQVLIKVFRRVQAGLNPDVELGTFLTTEAGLQSVPRVIGDLRMVMARGEEASIGIAQQFLSGSLDGWTWLGEQLIAGGEATELRTTLQQAIRSLGVVTAEIHLALASAESVEIAPQSIESSDIERWRSQTNAAVEAILARVKEQLSSIEHQEARTHAETLLTSADQLRESLAGYDALAGFQKTRVHGDYHLGQTLRRNDEWFVLDFEGEPARPLSERRARYSPLKDVAGMLRSLGNARAFATQAPSAWTDPSRTLERSFLDGYRGQMATSPLAANIIPSDEATFSAALHPWIIDKAIYEIAYELDNRPSWLWMPIMSLFAGEE